MTFDKKIMGAGRPPVAWLQVVARAGYGRLGPRTNGLPFVEKINKLVRP